MPIIDRINDIKTSKLSRNEAFYFADEPYFVGRWP